MIPYGKYRPTGFDPSGLGLEGRQDWLVVGIPYNRDSGVLDESNWVTARKALLSGLDETDTCEEHEFGHWACGWFRLLLVKPGSKAEQCARELEAALDNYPILNDDDHSEREQVAADELWQCMRFPERVRYFKRHRSEFEFRGFADMLGCFRGKYFAGYASELVNS